MVSTLIVSVHLPRRALTFSTCTHLPCSYSSSRDIKPTIYSKLRRLLDTINNYRAYIIFSVFFLCCCCQSESRVVRKLLRNNYANIIVVFTLFVVRSQRLEYLSSTCFSSAICLDQKTATVFGVFMQQHTICCVCFLFYIHCANSPVPVKQIVNIWASISEQTSPLYIQYAVCMACKFIVSFSTTQFFIRIVLVYSFHTKCKVLGEQRQRHCGLAPRLSHFGESCAMCVWLQGRISFAACC